MQDILVLRNHSVSSGEVSSTSGIGFRGEPWSVVGSVS